jgi:hypothetical protein
VGGEVFVGLGFFIALSNECDGTNEKLNHVRATVPTAHLLVSVE